jgi:hypothetical protein
VGGFSTVGAGGGIWVFKTTRTTDFSTTSTTPVLVMSMTITLNVKSNLLILLQAFVLYAYNYGGYHAIYLDGAEIRKVRNASGVYGFAAIAALATDVSPGSHTIEYYAWETNSLGTIYAYQPIDLIAIAIPA